jgi:hypothetical protein
MRHKASPASLTKSSVFLRRLMDEAGRRGSPDVGLGALFHVLARCRQERAPGSELESKLVKAFNELPHAVRNVLMDVSRSLEHMDAFRRMRAFGKIALLPIDVPVTAEHVVVPLRAEVTGILPHAGLPRREPATLRLLGTQLQGVRDLRVTVTAGDRSYDLEILARSPGSITVSPPPAFLTKGFPTHHWLTFNVSSREYLISERIWHLDPGYSADVAPPPPVPPMIKDVSPKGQRPSESVFIDGGDFVPMVDMSGCTVHIEPLEEGTGPSFHVPVDGTTDPKTGWHARFVSTTQVKLTLGVDIPPGKYQIHITNTRGGTVVSSNYTVYDVQGWSYTVQLISFSNTDESNEASGSDELQTITAVAADDVMFMHASGEYEGVDQGGTYEYRIGDQMITAPTGMGAQVTKLLALVVRLYEIDSSLGTAGGNDAAGAGKIAEALVSSGNDYAMAAGAVLLILGASLEAVAKSGEGSDFLGEQRRTWTAVELLQMTPQPTGTFQQTMDFSNADSEGSNSVLFQIRRILL